MNLKRNITFQLESRKKDGVLVTENVPIRMRVVFDGKRIEFTTGYRIDTAKWDASKQRVKNGCTNKLKQTSSEINADLNRYEGEIQNIFKEDGLVNFMWAHRMKSMVDNPDDFNLVQCFFGEHLLSVYPDSKS